MSESEEVGTIVSNLESKLVIYLELCLNLFIWFIKCLLKQGSVTQYRLKNSNFDFLWALKVICSALSTSLLEDTLSCDKLKMVLIMCSFKFLVYNTQWEVDIIFILIQTLN